MWLAIAGFVDVRGQKAKESGRPPRSWKRQGDEFFSGASRGNMDLLIPCLLAQWNLGQPPDPQGCKIIHSHCFKPLKLCYFAITAIGNFMLRAVSGLRTKYKVDPPFPLCKMTSQLLDVQKWSQKNPTRFPQLFSLSTFSSSMLSPCASSHPLSLSLN